MRAARVTSRSSKKAERQAPWREPQRGLQPACGVGKPVADPPCPALQVHLPAFGAGSRKDSLEDGAPETSMMRPVLPVGPLPPSTRPLPRPVAGEQQLRWASRSLHHGPRPAVLPRGLLLRRSGETDTCFSEPLPAEKIKQALHSNYFYFSKPLFYR